MHLGWRYFYLVLDILWEPYDMYPIVIWDQRLGLPHSFSLKIYDTYMQDWRFKAHFVPHVSGHVSFNVIKLEQHILFLDSSNHVVVATPK